MPNDKEATCPVCGKKPGVSDVITTASKDGYSNHRSILVCPPCRMGWTADTGWKAIPPEADLEGGGNRTRGSLDRGRVSFETASPTMPDEQVEEVKREPCSVCGAGKGDPCRNEKGEPMESAAHAGRISGGGPLKVRLICPKCGHDDNDNERAYCYEMVETGAPPPYTPLDCCGCTNLFHLEEEQKRNL